MKAGEGLIQTDGDPPAAAAADAPREDTGAAGGKDVILSMALLLVRHAMQDTFGNGAITVDDAAGEINISTDGARARLRVVVAPPPPSPRPASGGPPSSLSNAAAAGEEGRGMQDEAAAWRCEVVECARESLRSQVSLLVERLRLAVSRC